MIFVAAQLEISLIYQLRYLGFATGLVSKALRHDLTSTAMTDDYLGDIGVALNVYKEGNLYADNFGL